MSLLNEFWIISSDGLPVYHQTLTEELDQSLFGGFISAIQIFIKELGEEEIKKLEMGGSKIIILSSEDREWFFIGKSNIKAKEKKIHKYLSEIREIFFKHYRTVLKDWNKNTEIFQELDNLIDIKNPETPEKQKQMKSQKTRGGFL